MKRPARLAIALLMVATVAATVRLSFDRAHEPVTAGRVETVRDAGSERLMRFRPYPAIVLTVLAGAFASLARVLDRRALRVDAAWPGWAILVSAIPTSAALLFLSLTPAATAVATSLVALCGGVVWLDESATKRGEAGLETSAVHRAYRGLRDLTAGDAVFGSSTVGVHVELHEKSRTSSGDASLAGGNGTSPGFAAARELMGDAVLHRATDVHLEPAEESFTARYRIDGVVYEAGRLTNRTGLAALNVFKNVAAMDIAERRRPQDGSFVAVVDDERLDVRVASQGTRSGEKLGLRLLRSDESLTNLSGLGLDRHLQGRLREVVEHDHGLLLAAGPTGAGKSTTIRAAIGELDPYSRTIVTIEDPVEHRLEGVSQIEVERGAGQTFAGILRSVLRQDPDVILVGEIRDAETASTACRAANTGHVVFSTVHANDAVATLGRLIELGADPVLVKDAVSAVLAQRLVRRLCRHCRRPHEPARGELRRLRLPPNRVYKFARPGAKSDGCGTCRGIGFLGRIGVFELLVLDDEARRSLVPFDSERVRAAALDGGTVPLGRAATRLALKGVTSLDEIDRLLA